MKKILIRVLDGDRLTQKKESFEFFDEEKFKAYDFFVDRSTGAVYKPKKLKVLPCGCWEGEVFVADTNWFRIESAKRIRKLAISNAFKNLHNSLVQKKEIFCDDNYTVTEMGNYTFVESHYGRPPAQLGAG